MSKELMQRELLMTQLDKKRMMKQKYLRENASEPEATSFLTELVMTNVMLMAIRKRANVFHFIENFDAKGDMSFEGIMNWLGELAEGMDCGVYEFFVEDKCRQRRTINELLLALEPCDSWENIRVDEQGEGRFLLVGFDYAYRMADRPSGSLLFEKKPEESGFQYTLTFGDGKRHLSGVPGYGVLWKEKQGMLQNFVDRVLEDANSGWSRIKIQFETVLQSVRQEEETLRDLRQLLMEVSNELNVIPLLIRSAERLREYRQKIGLLYGELPEGIKQSGRGKSVENTLFLLAAAGDTLERMSQGEAESMNNVLEEVIYLLNHAGQPM